MNRDRDGELLQSPRINRLTWGRIEVAGSPQVFKDAKLFPGGAREWDWGETGTRHIPGIQPADVIELLEKGARVVVIGIGFHQRLQITQETLGLLASHNVATHALQSEEAVRRYNELIEGERVGALIHSTC